MKSNRLFYDDHLNLRNLSKKKVLLSIVIGLLSAFVIYSFSYVLRETMRVMSFEFDLYPNIISEVDRSFYNLFFASLAVIFGNSIAVSFLFSRPQNLMSTRSPKRKQIINEQIFLNFNFAYWFGKLGLMFGAFSMCCMSFPYSSTPKYIAILLIVALYLESTKTLNKVLKKKKWKFMLIHTLLLFLLSLGLSKIDTVNYKAIDAMALEANPIVDLPNSFFYQKISNRKYPTVTFKIFRDRKNKNIIRNELNEEIQIHDLSSEINRVRNSVYREELIDFLKVRISADKSTELNYIKQLEAELFLINQREIIYNVYNEDELSRSYELRGFSKITTPDVLQFRPKEVSIYSPLVSSAFPYYPSFKDTLNVHVQNAVIIDGLAVSNALLVSEFKKSITQDRAINYIISKETTYQDYITSLSAHWKAVHELREEHQIFLVGYKGSQAYNDEQAQLRKKYPIMAIETYEKN